MNVSSAFIESGSSALRELLLQDIAQQQVLANFHGHSHRPVRCTDSVGSVSIINPKPLRDGYFSVVRLMRDEGRNGRWVVAGSDFGCVALSADLSQERL